MPVPKTKLMSSIQDMNLWNPTHRDAVLCGRRDIEFSSVCSLRRYQEEEDVFSCCRVGNLPAVTELCSLLTVSDKTLSNLEMAILLTLQ